MMYFRIANASQSQIARLLRSLTYEELQFLSQSNNGTADLEAILNEVIVLEPTDVTEECRYCNGHGYYYKVTKPVGDSADGQKGSE